MTRFQGDQRAFPTPERVASAGEAHFQTTVRMGYCGPYVRQLAREIVEGRRDLEALKASGLSGRDLKRELKGIMGVGDYAASTLLMLLGHYGELAIDRKMRSFVSQRFFEGSPVTDGQIAAVYEKWGK